MNAHPLPAPAGDLAGRRVAKKIRPGQRGAIKLARMHGEALLCVRYRENADGSKRLMTGELLLEMTVIQKRDDPIVSFKIKPKEIGLRRPAQSKGGWYEGKNFRKLARSQGLRIGLMTRIEVRPEGRDHAPAGQNLLLPVANFQCARLQS